jgi:hypothetical protein
VSGRIRSKNLGRPDDALTFEHGRMDLVTLGELTVGRRFAEPGWRWSTHIRPVVGGESCQNRHVGVVVSGRLGIVTEDGRSFGFGPDDVFDIAERAVRDVGLPPLVRHLGGEPDERAARPLLRLRGDEPATLERPPDRRDRRSGAVSTLKVRRDREGAGVKPRSARCLRSSTISCSRGSEIRCGLVLGRRGLGSSPASPSARYRRTSPCTQRLETT